MKKTGTPNPSRSVKPVTGFTKSTHEPGPATPAGGAVPVGGMPWDRLFNRPTPPDTFLTPEASLEQQLQQQKLQAEQQRAQEKVIFDRKQKELAKRIEEIRRELIKLAKEIGQEARHIEKQLLTHIPEPSEYHLSFLDKIKKILILLRKKINDSRTWLEEWQARSKKRRYYWYHFKKSGTKFWLSGERAVATQTG